MFGELPSALAGVGLAHELNAPLGNGDHTHADTEVFGGMSVGSIVCSSLALRSV